MAIEKLAEKLVDKATQPKALLGMAAFGIIGGAIEFALGPTLTPSPGKIATAPLQAAAVIGGPMALAELSPLPTPGKAATTLAAGGAVVEGLLAATPVPTPGKIATAAAGIGSIVPTPGKVLGTLGAAALVIGAPIPTPGKAAATFIGGAMAHLGPLVALGAAPIIAKGLAKVGKKLGTPGADKVDELTDKLPGMGMLNKLIPG